MPNKFSVPFIQKIFFGSSVWCCLFLLPNVVQSATGNSVTLQWAANSESDLAGYRVYRGTTAGVYGLSIDVGKVTTYTISNLQSGSSNYFAITAYDMSGNESLPSQEVSKYISDSSGSSLLTDGLNDDFNDGNFAGWQVVNEGTWDAPSAWTVVGGALQQTSNIYDGNTDGTCCPRRAPLRGIPMGWGGVITRWPFRCGRRMTMPWGDGAVSESHQLLSVFMGCATAVPAIGQGGEWGGDSLEARCGAVCDGAELSGGGGGQRQHLGSAGGWGVPVWRAGGG